MRRRSVFAALALCAALVFSLGSAKALWPSIMIPWNGAKLVYICTDAKPHHGTDPCPEDRMLWIESDLLLNHPIKK